MTAPLPHIQFFEKALEVNNLLSHAEQVFKEEISDISDASSSDSDADLEEEKKKKKGRNGIVDLTSRNSVSIQEQKPERKKMYNLGASSEEREWLKEILLSSDSDLSEDEKITEQDLKEMLKLHYLKNKVHKEFQKRSDEVQDEYQYYGSSFVLERNKYADIQKKKGKDHHRKVFKKKVTSESSSLKKKRLQQIDEKRRRLLEEKLQKKKIQRQKEIENKRKKLWILIARKEVPKACKQRNSSRGNDLQSLKKISQNCQKEVRKEALRSQKISKETMPRARRIVKEMMLYWKKFDKVEKEHRKKVEKEALEQRRLDEEMREMRRQQRKLNFLITQTELYAHFMGRKMKAPVEARKTQEEILKKLDEVAPRYNSRTVQGGVVVDMESQDDYGRGTMALIKGLATEPIGTVERFRSSANNK